MQTSKFSTYHKAQSLLYALETDGILKPSTVHKFPESGVWLGLPAKSGAGSEPLPLGPELLAVRRVYLLAPLPLRVQPALGRKVHCFSPLWPPGWMVETRLHISRNLEKRVRMLTWFLQGSWARRGREVVHFTPYIFAYCIFYL